MGRATLSSSPLRTQGPITTGRSCSSKAVYHLALTIIATAYGSRIGARYARLSGTTWGERAFAFSRQDMPELLQIRWPSSKQRAQGKPGADCTRGLVCKSAHCGRTRAYRFSRNSPAFPAQWFYGVLRALPGERIRLVTVACEIILASLAPATGVRTTRLGRTPRRFVRRCNTTLSEMMLPRLTPKRPSHPKPNVS